jgi:glycosyltransferase involved in cell wall biosynthesis
VHSTEYDRAGEGASARIVEVERFGMEAATLVIAVSHYTRSIIVGRYAIAPDKVAVVHNGVYPAGALAAYRRAPELAGRQVVLYLGRVTYQKGPDYFIEAAAKVLGRAPRAHFVLAGTGDMLPRLQRRVEELGVADRFSFPGFLRGRSVERMFCQADVFVMPSVSEPFGLVALEAMSNRTPVVVSRQSGVAEALRHVLKFDFWDVDDLAAKVIALLRYPEVRREMVARAAEEVTRFQWDAAARRVRELYARALAG